MLLTAQHLGKNIGAKTLFHDLNIQINEKEKVALIGRNGQGKTTLLHILGGIDTEFDGELIKKKNLVTVLTKQEHFLSEELTALEYILASVPHFHEYEKIIADFENGVTSDAHRYMVAHAYCSENGYFYMRELILKALLDFQIDSAKALGPLPTLSGGEKRFVELVRMMYAKADVLLIDEPTNHMDYIGKERFIAWMKATKEGVLVVTHDRDVLAQVDRIVELKDQSIFSFNGDYAHYLRQNTDQTKNSVVLYQNQLSRLADAKKKVDWGLQMRAKSKAWKIRYDHWQRDYDKIKSQTVKPSFWIDQDSVENLDKTVSESYHKFKEKNIKIVQTGKEERTDELLAVKDLSLGYDGPLFSHLSFTLDHKSRVFIKGRNGAGKSTLVQTILARQAHSVPDATLFAGDIIVGSKCRLGKYDQEIDQRILSMTVEDAVMMVYRDCDEAIDTTRLKKILAQYLFNPILDSRLKIGELSGGQKARFQLIKMFANTPNVLILDEPTNHLDLPSIEELEKALLSYSGGILYISHDTNFIAKLGGKTAQIEC